MTRRKKPTVPWRSLTSLRSNQWDEHHSQRPRLPKGLPVASSRHHSKNPAVSPLPCNLVRKPPTSSRASSQLDVMFRRTESARLCVHEH
jgi:hypothetical protein